MCRLTQPNQRRALEKALLDALDESTIQLVETATVAEGIAPDSWVRDMATKTT